jgi:hypothetical protein
LILQLVTAAGNLVALTNYLSETLTFEGINLLNDSNLLSVTCESRSALHHVGL